AARLPHGPRQPSEARAGVARTAAIVLCHSLWGEVHLGGHGRHAQEHAPEAGSAMIRVVIENVLLFLLPTAIYLAYVLLMRRETTSPATVINEAPLIWLFILGALCVTATLVYYATVSPGGTPGQVYIPPRMKDGKIEPGQLK